VSVATPGLTFAATLSAGIGLNQSQNFTFTVHITQAWQTVVPVIVRFPTNVSAGPQISVYRSTDGGTTFDSIPLQPLGYARQSGGSAQGSIKLETGQYAIQVLTGGGSSATWTIQVLTQQVMTGILNA
jgi:hypothetical protein